MGVSCKGHAPAGFTPGTLCIGDWGGPTTGLEGCAISRHHRNFAIIFLPCPLI